jgi:hypothetical protein
MTERAENDKPVGLGPSGQWQSSSQYSSQYLYAFGSTTTLGAHSAATHRLRLEQCPYLFAVLAEREIGFELLVSFVADDFLV